jgi:hypothetical protein
MEALAATAPYNHAEALKNSFYKYLKGKASIGVPIPVCIEGFDIHRMSSLLMLSYAVSRIQGI